MPFARHSGFSFSPVSVRQNAPAWGGIYGLSNAQGWIYINEAENIQVALIEHFNKRGVDTDLQSVTGFNFELCEPDYRPDRCRRLIEELHPKLKDRVSR